VGNKAAQGGGQVCRKGKSGVVKKGSNSPDQSKIQKTTIKNSSMVLVWRSQRLLKKASQRGGKITRNKPESVEKTGEKTENARGPEKTGISRVADKEKELVLLGGSGNVLEKVLGGMGSATRKRYGRGFVGKGFKILNSKKPKGRSAASGEPSIPSTNPETFPRKERRG